MRTDEYYAGLFDGEGCVLIRKLRRYQSEAEIYDYSIQAGIVMTDPRPIMELKEIYGGSTCKARIGDAIRRPTWRWTAVSQVAYRFLIRIHPFTLVKREEIAGAIRFQQHLNRYRHGHRVKNKKGYHGYPAWIMKYREGVYHHLQALKKRVLHP
jgi:hypothetical protein